MFKKNLIVVFGVCMYLAIAAGSAQAMLVQNGATTLYSDTFEAASNPSPFSWEHQNANPGDRTDSDPDSAFGGPWDVVEGAIYDTQVTSAPASAYDPGAYEGENYLRLNRPGSAGNFTRSFFDVQTSGTVHVEFMANINTNVDFDLKFVLVDSSGNSLLYLATRGNYIEYHSNGWKWTPVPFTRDTWQKWTIDYVPYASTFDFSVDSVSATVDVQNSGNVTRIELENGIEGARAYIDAVPEPATMILLSVGALALRRRKR